MFFQKSFLKRYILQTICSILMFNGAYTQQTFLKKIRYAFKNTYNIQLWCGYWTHIQNIINVFKCTFGQVYVNALFFTGSKLEFQNAQSTFRKPRHPSSSLRELIFFCLKKIFFWNHFKYYNFCINELEYLNPNLPSVCAYELCEICLI